MSEDTLKGGPGVVWLKCWNLSGDSHPQYEDRCGPGIGNPQSRVWSGVNQTKFSFQSFGMDLLDARIDVEGSETPDRRTSCGDWWQRRLIFSGETWRSQSSSTKKAHVDIVQ